MSTSLTRRISFDAAHRYWRADWSDDQNRRVFGSWATPNFHGHEYVCDVTVSGEVNSVTGMLVDLGWLDRILKTQVHDRFDHREINLDVPEFADGLLVPTCENLSRFIAECVQGAGALLVSVGPAFATRPSLCRTPLPTILPAAPLGELAPGD